MWWLACWAAEPGALVEGADPAGDELKAALLAAGVCARSGTILKVETVALSDGRGVHEAQCVLGAYQGNFEYSFAEPMGPIRTTAGETFVAAGWPELSVDGEVRVFAKARGLGDCGSKYLYRLRGDAFGLVEERGRACTDELPDPDAEWPLVDRGHCTNDEIVWFTCDAGKGRALSVCGRVDGVQYRFGPRGAPGLMYPADSAPGAFAIEEVRPPRFGHRLRFRNEDVVYTVFEVSRADNIGGHWHTAGVDVARNGTSLAAILCTGPVSARWTDLARRVRPGTEAP
ncbi:MAG: hypothetical protein KC656_23290 [Myxococcales bacterium]|nr:hypothetical protein [Myxococcales bacterium]